MSGLDGTDSLLYHDKKNKTVKSITKKSLSVNLLIGENYHGS